MTKVKTYSNLFTALKGGAIEKLAIEKHAKANFPLEYFLKLPCDCLSIRLHFFDILPFSKRQLPSFLKAINKVPVSQTVSAPWRLTPRR